MVSSSKLKPNISVEMQGNRGSLSNNSKVQISYHAKDIALLTSLDWGNHKTRKLIKNVGRRILLQEDILTVNQSANRSIQENSRLRTGLKYKLNYYFGLKNYYLILSVAYSEMHTS